MITMAEIAKRAGVSRATASLVINDRDTSLRISLATRQRVLAVVEEMGYRRNELARAVVTGKNFVLGLLERRAGLEQKALILEGALAEAEKHGYLIKVWPRPNHDNMSELARRCVEQRLAGLIVVRPVNLALDRLYEELTRYGIPMVLVDDEQSDFWAVNISSDDRQGSRQAVDHLVGLGHRRISCIAGNPKDPLSIVREQGYREAMQAHGLPVLERAVVFNNWRLDQTDECVRQLFGRRDEQRPTGLFFAAGDAFAAVGMRVLRELGLQVPADVSVVGYANLELAAVLDPALTTIAQTFEAMGRVAVSTLIGMIAGEYEAPVGGPLNRFLPTELVVRGSTASVATETT